MWRRCRADVGQPTSVSQNEHDYWPNTLYDAREAQTRDATPVASTDIALAGVMHYVELDVNNLRRWLAGQFAGVGAPNGVNAKNDNGYIVYFSDRRGKNVGGAGAAARRIWLRRQRQSGDRRRHCPTGSSIRGEDANGNGTLDTSLGGRRGTCRREPRLHVSRDFRIRCMAQRFVTASIDQREPWRRCSGGCELRRRRQVATATPAAVKALVARANRPLFFRRALKIVNGGLGNLPNGLTIASENPVYVQGNYNAQANDTLADPHVPAAIIADAVTLLSNGWNDIRSFVNSPAESCATVPRRRRVIAWRSSLARACRSRVPRAGRRRRTSAPTAARTTSFACWKTGTTAQRSITAARSSASSLAGRRSEA